MADKHTRYNQSEKGKLKHREYMRDYMREWRKLRKESSEFNPEEERRKWREQHRQVRERAIEKLGGRRCAECGCDELRILEINHVHGGGRQELKATQNRQFYRAIVNDKVDLSAYNVLCRVCNALHYVRDVLGINGHDVVWRGSLIG
ncbi:hypothetical protein BH10ACI3_BH10ACI3_19420 [soil metagenome]